MLSHHHYIQLKISLLLNAEDQHHENYGRGHKLRIPLHGLSHHDGYAKQ